MSETPSVGRELKRAILCLLLYPGTEWKIRVDRQCYVFILTDFKNRCFYVSFLTSTCVNNYFKVKNFPINLCPKHFVYWACYVRDKAMVSLTFSSFVSLV